VDSGRAAQPKPHDVRSEGWGHARPCRQAPSLPSLHKAPDDAWHLGPCACRYCHALGIVLPRAWPMLPTRAPMGTNNLAEGPPYRSPLELGIGSPGRRRTAMPPSLPRDLVAAASRLLGSGACLILAAPNDWSAAATPTECWTGRRSQRGPCRGDAESLLPTLVTPDGHPQPVAGPDALGLWGGVSQGPAACAQPWRRSQPCPGLACRLGRGSRASRRAAVGPPTRAVSY